jgi:hypothetical protein
MISKKDHKELDAGLKLIRKNLLSTDINELLVVNRYEQFSIDINDAKSKNLIIGLPVKAIESKIYDEERLKVIRDRLHNLGYLNKENIKSVLDDHAIDSGLKSAIQNFQQDANLKVDGWIGDKAWLALQQLVTIEEPTQISHWLKENGEVNNALKRGAQLRLYILGLGEKPKISSTASSLELTKFREVALNLFEGIDELNEMELLELLFDQDLILEHLSKYSGNINFIEKSAEQKFVIAVTKIELWLHGEENIIPDANLIEQHKEYRVGPRGRRRRIKSQLDILNSNLQINSKSYFYKALNFTWSKLLGRRNQEVKNKSINYIKTFPEFFQLLNGLEDVDDLNFITPLDKYINKSKKNIKAIWKSAKSLAGKLFDGIKRIGKMISRFFGKVIDTTVKWLARPFYNLIVNAYKILKISIESIIEASTFLFSKYLKFKDNNSAFAIKQKDVDMTLFVDDQNYNGVLDFSQKLVLVSKRFKVSSKLISTFLSLLKGVFLTAITGWWAFFTTCAGLYKDFPNLIKSITFLNERSLKWHS